MCVCCVCVLCVLCVCVCVCVLVCLCCVPICHRTGSKVLHGQNNIIYKVQELIKEMTTWAEGKSQTVQHKTVHIK